MSKSNQWRDVTLGQVCSLRGGSAFSPKLQGRPAGDYPFIKVRDFNAVGNEVAINSADNWVIAADLAEIPGRPFEPGTSVFAKIGEALKQNRVRLLRRPTLIDNNLMGAAPRQDVVTPAFLFHFLRTVDFAATNAGTAVPYLTAANLNRLPLRLPPLDIQRRIADILSAYDDLIENNERRIAILAEMARRVFREWFVDFRFPGHEAVSLKITELGQLPGTWSWATLQEVCLRSSGIQTGPFGSQLHQSDYTEEGVPVVMPKNLINLRVVERDIARIPERLADELGRHRMRLGDVVYGRRGDIGRRAFITAREDGWFCGTGCLRLRPDPAIAVPRYLFDALGLPITENTIKGRALGATMPNLSAGALATVPVLLPPMALQARYAMLVEDFEALSSSLVEACEALRTSRDLLLPRLISSELNPTAAERMLEAAE